MNQQGKTRETKQGSVLVFSLLILSTMLVTSLAVLSSALLDRKASLSTGSSARSFQVADSGMEESLYRIYKQNHATLAALASAVSGTCSGGIVTFPIAGGKSAVSFYKGDPGVPGATLPYTNCGGPTGEWRDQVVKIKVEGTAGPTTRAVEVAVRIDSWSGCGDDLVDDRDGTPQVYGTVDIDGQCWMTKNMNVGSLLALGLPVLDQTDDGNIERYCPNNNPAECETKGGFYQWREAMDYSTTEGAQGICPDGWHIPTDAEWHDLELFYTDGANPCLSTRSGVVAGWACNSAGADLRLIGGTSGFDAVVGVGYISGNNAVPIAPISANFWSSSSITAATALSRGLDTAHPTTIYRNSAGRALGFSVRCILD